MKVFYILIFIHNINPIFATSFMNKASLEKVKSAVVSITTRSSVSAYQDTGVIYGTGFIVDKKQGLIITNAHLINRASISNYVVTFYNGRQAQCKLMYYDIWQDYAFLKVNFDDMPSEAEEIMFAKEKPQLNQKVFIVGNNEGNDFSFHEGYISSLYNINGEMPQGSYIINLNSTGGSSGSPVLNGDNEAVGIIYGGSKTYSLALNGGYIKLALIQIRNNNLPIRKHVGIITDLYSLDKAVKHTGFPKKLAEEYSKKFPDARNSIIAIDRIIAGTTTAKVLEPGDIIWQVNGQQIGADLFLLDKLMDENQTNKIKFTIYREGEKLETDVELYNINNNKIDKMIEFAGAIFFESDDLFSSKTGIPLKSIAINNIQTGSPFGVIPYSYYQDNKNMYRLKIISINQQKLDNLRDLEKSLPNLISKKFLNIKFQNHQFYYPWYSYTDSTFNSSQDIVVTNIEIDSIDSTPRILQFDLKAFEWAIEK